MASEVHQKLFTVSQANATLPLVRAICTDLRRLTQDVIERRQRVALLAARRSASAPSAGGDMYAEELEHIQDELEKDRLQLQQYVDELRELGVEPKDGIEGLVDFPSLHDGRVVYLCWKLGEPEVSWWHEIEAGFTGRQPMSSFTPDN